MLSLQDFDEILVEMMDKLVTMGRAKPAEIHGCSPQEVDELANAQGVILPHVYRAFMMKMGKKASDFYVENRYLYPYSSYLKQLKQIAMNIDPNFSISDDTFIFFKDDEGIFHYFHTLDGDDPPIYVANPINNTHLKIFGYLSMYLREAIEGYIDSQYGTGNIVFPEEFLLEDFEEIEPNIFGYKLPSLSSRAEREFIFALTDTLSWKICYLFDWISLEKCLEEIERIRVFDEKGMEWKPDYDLETWFTFKNGIWIKSTPPIHPEYIAQRNIVLIVLGTYYSRPNTLISSIDLNRGRIFRIIRQNEKDSFFEAFYKFIQLREEE